MLFSQTSEYALRVVVFLATLRGKPATTRQIAAATKVPEGYLSKILQNLSRYGLVSSQRGLHGGSILTKDPATLSVFDVVTAVAPIPRILTCPLGLKSHGTRLCPLHKRLDDAVALVEKAFQESTIADIMAENTGSIPLEDLGVSEAAGDRAAEIVFPVERPQKPTELTVGGKRRKKS